MSIVNEDFWAETDDGWRLHLKRTRRDGALAPGRRPLVIIPGYGMNGFIFGFHPRGTSLEAHFAHEGLEVWTANLRAQGRSTRARADAAEPSLAAFADLDVTAVLAAVLARTETGADHVDVLGASLGGSITFAHLALHPAHRVRTMVAIGSPLRWETVPWFLRIPFASRRVASLVRVNGARAIASTVLPLVRHAPMALSVYMNAKHVDLGAASELVKTVEDPHPGVNRDLAAWMKTRDLWVERTNVCEALRSQRAPLLLVVANRDGIVPTNVATSPERYWGGDVTTLQIGTDDDWYAHADLFIGDDSPRLVFEPIAAWLAKHA